MVRRKDRNKNHYIFSIEKNFLVFMLLFFVAKFLILMQLGAKHVESPFIEFGQISTVLYFAHFVIIVPFVTLLENSLIDLALSKNIIVPKLLYVKLYK
jgi:quinol-cytochrome oxidoreductase complex cytochrome b subunit